MNSYQFRYRAFCPLSYETETIRLPSGINIEDYTAMVGK